MSARCQGCGVRAVRSGQELCAVCSGSRPTPRRTARGKVVGSYRQPQARFTVERYRFLFTDPWSWVVVAPSGARTTRHATRPEAEAEAARQNAEWGR